MIFWDTKSATTDAARNCVVYVVRPSDARRGAMTTRLAAANWNPVAWAWDDRFEADRPLDLQQGIIDALGASVVTAFPVIVLDPPPGTAGLMHVLATTAAILGTDVRLVDSPLISDAGPVRTVSIDDAISRGCRGPAACTGLSDLLALRTAVLRDLQVPDGAAENAVQTWSQPCPMPGVPAARATRVTEEPTDEPVPGRLGIYSRWYAQECEAASALGLRLPALPDPQSEWPVRRLAVGRLAHRLFRTWTEDQIAGLLNENCIRTGAGSTFFDRQVAYYRRTYGRAK